MDYKMVVRILFSTIVFLCVSCNMDYKEPTKEQIEYDSRVLYPIEFKGIVVDVENMGLAVRNHRLVSLKINNISHNIYSQDSLYCFKYDSATLTAKLVLTVESTSYNEAFWKNDILTKDSNSDTITAYDKNGVFIKKFKMFE